MNRIATMTWLLTLLSGGALAAGVSLTMQPDRVLNGIDEKVYGHFLEHIYHSCDGGLWGELVWNRSFEENEAGQWGVVGEEVVQSGMGTNIRLTFGDKGWTDYEYTLEARKTGGNEGFLILFRVKNEKEFYWCNLGGWGNKRHAIERGIKGQKRWGTVGRPKDGEIAEGKWCRIKVRCEGRRFQVWLDDAQIIDFTDDDKAHLSGGAGIGTWSTQARFRNLKVTSLDGRVLYKGVPEKLGQPAAGRHWQAYGPGQVFLDGDNALNTKFCQRIVAGDAETGVEQTPFCLKKGETYRGSVWARGKGKLVVRLLDGETELDKDSLGRVEDEWGEQGFKLKAKGDVESATLQVGVAAGGEVWIDQVSMMPESWRKAGGFRPDLLQAIADLKPPIIRWPGGCFASAYRWKQGIGPQHKRIIHPRSIWDQEDVYSYGTDEFIAMCRRVGAEPLIVVNIGTPNWVGKDREKEFEQEVLDWIEYCNGPADSKWGRVRAENGHPEPYNVKYWEIDNETWHMGAGLYAEWVNRLAPLMRKADPSIKLAACGSAGYGDGGNGLVWNRILIEQCADKVEYLSIHHYENPDRFAEGPLAYEAFFRKTADLIKTSKNPALKVYCSEWNAQSTDWRTGLYCGGLLNGFERCGEFFEIGGPALFLRHVSAKAWDNAFINFDHRTWFPAPNYVVMKLWRDHYAPQRIAMNGETGPLNALATRSEDGKTLYFKAVNPTKESVPVELAVDGVAVVDATMEVVAPGDLSARNTLEARNAVRPVAATVEKDGATLRVTLPPLSCGVVTVRSK